jgi:Flp pilus assembly protein TadG
MVKRAVTIEGRARGDRGAAMVEFALVLPVLLMLIFGVYAFTRGYQAKIELTGAVREAARATALAPSGDTDAEVRARAAHALEFASPGLVIDGIDVQRCPSGDDRAVVHATTMVTYTIPFFDEGEWQIEAEGAMRCAG